MRLSRLNQDNPERFTFHGFLPAKEGQRRTALESLRAHPSQTSGVQIFYETPHRILAALADIEAIFGSTQHVVVARELTKLHEEFLRGPVAELRACLAARTVIRGEIVLLFVPAAPAADTSAQTLSIAAEVAQLMNQEGLSEKDALKRVARTRGLGKSDAYRELQRERSR
jgi:16S rRNA (cytidine1402-2'-O)-methyltransferase